LLKKNLGYFTSNRGEEKRSGEGVKVGPFAHKGEKKRQNKGPGNLGGVNEKATDWPTT